ncbi:MAG: hypothetical protein DRR06_07665 [Gammaproteobacteria bacterium]|nr:MAG: hypothetical protein DRR06_07665 [Gammaproteobacteria bacterium]
MNQPGFIESQQNEIVSINQKLKGIKWACLGMAVYTGFSVNGISYADEAGPDYLREDDIRSPLEAAFEEPPVLKDQHWELHLRSYFLDRNTDQEADKQALATGGWLTWKSGYWWDLVQFSATAYTSQKVVGDRNKDGTGLLQDGQKSYGGFSSIYANVKLGERSTLRLGRFEMNIPYINKHDIRMIPNSFQGAYFVHNFSEKLDFGGAYITRIKDRTSTDFEEAYDRAGINGDDAIRVAGARYDDNAGHDGGVFGYYAPDALGMIYGEYNHHIDLNDDSAVIISAQYTHQSSVGDELGGDFSGNHYGTKLLWETSEITTTLAYTLYNGDRIRSGWGSVPGYTSVMVKDFNRTGEKAYLLGIDKDLAAWNLPGWNLGTSLTTGNTDDSGADASPDQSEWNLNLKYTFQNGPLNGLSVFFRYVEVNQKNSHVAKDAKDINGFRIITNYNIRF